MGDVRSLGYLGVTAPDVGAWEPFAAEVLGAAVRREGDVLHIRYDEYLWRIRVRPAPADAKGGLDFVGWEVADEAALEAVADRLSSAGYEVKRDSETARDRQVRDLVAVDDPNGLRNEFFYGPVHPRDAFVSPLGARFKTGDQGMGHFVLMAPNWEATLDFYLNLLGFQVSDTITAGWNDKGERVEAIFTRVNPRHHSLALLPASRLDIQHLMVELEDLSMVGRALDRALERGVELTTALGEHTNDRMTSFYVRTPSGFEIEVGTGGLEVDDESWLVRTYDSPSVWGHARKVG
jgi:2,3-dihydroxybiphenyl 1,2-dioxygenase